MTAEVLKFLKKTTENVQILQALIKMKFRGLRSTIFVIFALKNDGMSARNIIQDTNRINTTSSKIDFFINHQLLIIYFLPGY
jgi:hypothetical protein